MLKFQETAKHVSVSRANSACSDAAIARRYTVQRKLGNGSFGSVYLVSDKKAKQGDELKVLKEISVGDLKPNETVEANLEAQLLSKLDHPAIVKFYASFVERDSFCIITEYCEGGDLDYKIQEYKECGKSFTQRQIIEWFIQLLLGVNYMHERRILHRDLKTKNIFLKNNLLKIGDFGVSCLLMGSCDLATTFTGTPYYMSPEALKHQGYNTKSDIWSLGCILYEMCCMNHAFSGHNFLSVVLKIVEGDTPSLSDRYPSSLNAVLSSMLNKNPSLRPAAGEILKIPYIDEQLKNIQYNFTCMTAKDKGLNWQKEAAPIFDAVRDTNVNNSCSAFKDGPWRPFYKQIVIDWDQEFKRTTWQRKVHLQTLQQLSEVQKMTPRERMRLRKLNAADEKAKKLKQLAEEKYQENIKRMQEFRSRNFQKLNVNVLHESDDQISEPLTDSQWVMTCDSTSIRCDEPNGNERLSQFTDHEIPEDPQIAEEYYNEEFESCSEDSETEEDVEVSQTVSKTNHQDSDIEAMVKHLESILNNSSLGSATVTSMAPGVPQGFRALNSTMAETKLNRMRELCHTYHILKTRQTSELERTNKYSRWGLTRVELRGTITCRLPHSTGTYLLCPTSPNHDPLVSIHSDGYFMLRKLSKLTMRSAIQKLGGEVFEKVYTYLKQARKQKASEEEITRHLEKLVPRASDCFEVDQLLYFEEQLQDSGSCLQL